MNGIVCVSRYLAAAVLGVTVFAMFFLALALNAASDKLFNAEFYIGVLRDEDAYNRVYTEVLPDPEVKTAITEALGDVNIVGADDWASLLRQIVPPDYLQAETESALRQSEDYLLRGTGDAAIYVEAAPALDRAKPALLSYVDEKIAAVPIVQPNPAISAFTTEQQFQRTLNAAVADMAQGRLPSALPALTFIPPPFRGAAFDDFMEQLDREARARLEPDRGELRAAFVAGETRQTFRIAAHALLEPPLDEALAHLRASMEPGGRLDLVKVAEKHQHNPSEFRRDLTASRYGANWTRNQGGGVFLFAAILAAALLGLAFTPRVNHMLRWPGLALFLTGGVIFSIGGVARSRLLTHADAWANSSQGMLGGAPPSVSHLAGDLLRNAIEQLVGGFTGPALTLCLIGLAIFVASFFVGFALKPLGLAR